MHNASVVDTLEFKYVRMGDNHCFYPNHNHKHLEYVSHITISSPTLENAFEQLEHEINYMFQFSLKQSVTYNISVSLTDFKAYLETPKEKHIDGIRVERNIYVQLHPTSYDIQT